MSNISIAGIVLDLKLVLETIPTVLKGMGQ